MDLKQTLALLGLQEKEAAIYLAALELGTATAQDIAKKAGIQRTYFYDLSSRLINQGLLRQVERGGKRLFTAASPDRLRSMQEERLKEIERVLPELDAIRNVSGRKPRVYYYEGRQGIDEINYDSLREKGEAIAFTTPRFVSAESEKLSKEFIKRRIALGKRSRVIGGMSPELADLKRRDREELRETRILPADIFGSDVEIGMYGNKTFVTNYKEMFGFVVEDADFAATMKKIFNIVWESGKVVM